MKYFMIRIGKGSLNMMKRFSWLTLAFVLVVAIAVTGCGGGGKKKTNDTNGNDGNNDGGTKVLQFDTMWGEPGDGNGQFFSPYGVAVDSAGNVFIADRSNDRIQKFTSNGVYLTGWGDFNWPIGVALDINNGNVYVADSGNDRIQKFTANGTFVVKWGEFGAGDGQFDDPCGVAVDKDGNVYVADSRNNRIQIFSLSYDEFDNPIYTLVKILDKGVNNEALLNPIGVAVDSLGNIYVAENNAQRIQKFNKEGQYITHWGELGSDEKQFRNPHLITVDKDDNIYVADTDNHRIQKFNSVGSFLMQWGSLGVGEGQFDTPTGVAVDQDGNVYIADSGNHRIQKFKWVRK